jgi:hypothetical protein
MNLYSMQMLSALLLMLSSLCFTQTSPRTDNATVAVLEAFKTQDIVMLGEIHNNKQEYEWLDALVASPEFADLVDDVVVELGNSLYQKSVDRYIAGEAVRMADVQRAWRSTLGLGPPPPIYGDLYKWFVKQTCGVEASIRCEFSAAIRT